MGQPELGAADLADLEPFTLHQRAPLWFFILCEADVMADGDHLGPVGGRIVAEVIVGPIEGDRQSYLRQDPDWTPTYGTDSELSFVVLFTAAGVVAAIA